MSFSSDPYGNLVGHAKDFLKSKRDTTALDQEIDEFFYEFEKSVKTGNLDYFFNSNDSTDSSTNVSKENAGSKENVEPFANPATKRRGRSRKPTLADITDLNQTMTNLQIKKEKISSGSSTTTMSINSTNSEVLVEVKKEATEMPAPTKLPPRKKKIKPEPLDAPKRPTRTRNKNPKYNDSMEEEPGAKKNSDVILQSAPIPTIELSDDAEKESETESERSTGSARSTRSKMNRKVKAEVAEKPEPEVQKVRNTRTKTSRKEKRSRSSSAEQDTGYHNDPKKPKSNDEEADHQRETQNSKSDPPAGDKKSAKAKPTEDEKDVTSSAAGETGSKTPRSSSSIPRLQRSASKSAAHGADCNTTSQTEYEDAVSAVGSKNLDATYVTSSTTPKEAPPPALNSTMVVESPKVVAKGKEQQRFKEHPQKAVTPPKSKSKNDKQIFSPFDKTPLKKKVEAFERLGTDSSGIPQRTTRTKTRARKKDEEATEDETAKEDPMVKERPKVATPLTVKFMPKSCSTSKVYKLHPSSNSNDSTTNESFLSAKSSSALKVSQAEFRERERKRQEKEREALKKREALLQAQTEEKRRKREEKQMKAQQQREALEKEKLKHLEAQKIKEEKFKLAMAEREEKLQKQKEEAEKKRLNAKKKANEILKEKEEVTRAEEQKKYTEMKQMQDKESETAKKALKQKRQQLQQQQQLPLYMTTKPPLLPSEDCYDSDDPEYHLVKPRIPDWARESEINKTQRVIIAAGEQSKNSFFCRQAHTPDLREIFEIIDPKKLKRTSSAIWRKPPRYTLMPGLEDHPEFSEDSD